MASLDEHSLTFLLGAGASAEAGLPMSRQITQEMIDRLGDEHRDRQTSFALNFVVSAIIADDGRRGHRPDELPDIERVASAVELLATRSKLEIAPFVSTWEPALTTLEATPAREPAFLERDLVQAITGQGAGIRRPSGNSAGFEPNGRQLAKLLKDLIASQLTGQPSAVFARLLERLVSYLGDILSVGEEDRFDYLRPLVAIPRGGKGLVIATLNYDLGVETVARREGVELSRGIEDWTETGLLTFGDAPLKLLKLHGSLDWQRGHDRSPLRPREPLLPVGDAQRRPFLVFGQREKLRAEGPFLQLLEAFRTSLYASRTLVVLGYAFRDDHINECVAGWLVSEESRRILIVDPFYPDPGGWGQERDFQRDLLRWGAQAAEGSGGTGRLVVRREPAGQFLQALAANNLDAFLDDVFVSAATQGEG